GSREARARQGEASKDVSSNLETLTLPSPRGRGDLAYNPTIHMSITARLLLISLITARIAAAQAPDALFQSRCASCHAAGNAVGAPLPETLRQMSWQVVLAALETGKMKPVGDNLSATEREAIAKSLGTAVLNPMPPSAKCSAAPQRPSPTPHPTPRPAA